MKNLAKIYHKFEVKAMVGLATASQKHRFCNAKICLREAVLEACELAQILRGCNEGVMARGSRFGATKKPSILPRAFGFSRVLVWMIAGI